MLKGHLRAIRARQLLFAGLGIGLIFLALCAWLLHDLPSTDYSMGSSVAPSTIIYDRRGQVLYEITDPHSGRNRPVPLRDMPAYLLQATVATEDASFYSNPGVDLRAIIRALWINLRGGEVLSGGSTITQQLARNLLLAPQERLQRTLARKLRESILAYRLARSLRKDQILELYLNQTYYGNMAYGVDAAAHIYFGKPVQDLDLAECALLAGLPQAPAIHDPLTDPDAARERQLTVLDLMAKSRYISASEQLAAGHEALSFAATPFPIQAPHFVMYVWEILRREYGEETLYRHGLRVYTTLDLALQERAQDLVRLHLEELSNMGGDEPPHNVTDAAVVILAPSTGEILAMLGSADYFDPYIDGAVNVALMPRQPGSAIKPLTYAAAFEQGLTPATMMLDVQTTFVTAEGEAYTPVNYDRADHGPVLLRQALGSSLNIVAVKVLERIGVAELVAMSQRLGLSTLRDPHRFGLALTLGGGEVRLLELTAAYAAFANAGLSVHPRAILRVESQDGQALQLPAVPANNRAMEERIAFLVTDILADDSARIPAFGEGSVLALSRPAAVKTGTTSDWRDNWTIGFTPDLVVGVWVGNADSSPMVDVSGIDGAAPIWHHVMEEALKGKPVQAFQPPAGLVRVEICADSGKLPNPHCPSRRWEWFLAERAPQETCDMHRVIAMDQRTGQRAANGAPPEEVMTQLVMFVPAQLADWAEEHVVAANIPILVAPPDEHTGIPVDSAHGIVLTRPEDSSTYRLEADLPGGTQCIVVSAMVDHPDEVSEVRLYVDGFLLAAVRGHPFSALWQLTRGQHVLHAEAILQSGLICVSPVIHVTVL